MHITDEYVKTICFMTREPEPGHSTMNPRDVPLCVFLKTDIVRSLAASLARSAEMYIMI